MTETELLKRAQTTYKNLRKRYNKRSKAAIKSVSMVRQGNFTLVTINGDVVGMSKRHCRDQPNQETGVHIALNKALRHMLGIR